MSFTVFKLNLSVSAQNTFNTKRCQCYFKRKLSKILPVSVAAIKSIKTLLSRNLQPNSRPVLTHTHTHTHTHTRCRWYESHLTQLTLKLTPFYFFPPFSSPPNPNLSNPSSQLLRMLISAEVNSLSCTISSELLRCVLTCRAFAVKNFTFRFLSSLHLLSASS